MVTRDALDRRTAALRGRADAVDPESSEGLFLRKALRQLARAWERLGDVPGQIR